MIASAIRAAGILAILATITTDLLTAHQADHSAAHLAPHNVLQDARHHAHLSVIHAAQHHAASQGVQFTHLIALQRNANHAHQLVQHLDAHLDARHAANKV